MIDTLTQLLQALSEWPGAIALRRSEVAYLLINAAHIVSIGLIIGAILTLDFTILGLLRQAPLEALGRPLSRVAALGVTCAILTGAVLFTVRPLAYVQNTAFLVKVALIGLAVANALILRRNRHWHSALTGGRVHPSVRVAALFSALLWIAAILAGRWIGFL